MQKEIQELLKPDILNSIKGLELLSKMVIGAFSSGYNQSIFAGQGFEFRQYRSYQPGDDLRLLDWKMYARSDRYYIREAEAETNIIVRFVLDASASMLHQDKNHVSKLDFMRLMVASIAYLALQQGDAIGLYVCNENQLLQIPAKSNQLHFQNILYELLKIKADGQFAKALSPHLLQGQQGYKEMYIYISDMYEHGQEISKLIKQSASRKNEVLLLHLMAENERYLNYDGVFTFQDLESGEQIQADTKQIKKEYLASMEQNLVEIKKNMLEMGVDYDLFLMNESLDKVLRNFLLKRKKLI